MKSCHYRKRDIYSNKILGGIVSDIIGSTREWYNVKAGGEYRMEYMVMMQKTKATLLSGFLVAHCARDSGGGGSVACWSQTLKTLCKLLYLHSHRTHGQIHRFSYSESTGGNTLIYNNIVLHKHKRSTYG